MSRRLRLEPEDIIVGLDLAGEQHQAVIYRAAGERLTRLRVPHSLRGFDDLLLRTRVLAPQSDRRRVFAFEATGHVWEGLAHYLTAHGEEYVIVNPLATFRLREARQMNRHKTDITDAEQIAELVRNDLVTETKLEGGPYLELRRSWVKYARLREERARPKTLLSHQLYGVFPELRSVWSDLFAPGCLAVLRLIDELAKDIQERLASLEEAHYLLSIPSISWSSAAGILAHIGSIAKYRHGRQLIKLAGTNPSRRNTGARIGRQQGMTHRGRAGLRQVLYMATLSCLQHNPRIQAHFDRLIAREERPLPRMQAFGTGMNKLLLYAFAVMKKQEIFDTEHAGKGVVLVA